jgi:hypothetical protein
MEIGVPAARAQAGTDYRDSMGNVEVVSVTGPAAVKPGDDGKTITVRLHNPSADNPVRVTETALSMKLGEQDVTGQYVIAGGPNPVLPQTIAAGANTDFTFTVNVKGTATAGSVTVDAKANGFNNQGGVSDDGATTPLALPVVAVGDVSFAPATIPADGQTTSTASATTVPEGRALTWSFVGDAKGCEINAQGVVTAGQQTGQITVRATDTIAGASADGTLTLTPP